jgi:hypothetical protein
MAALGAAVPLLMAFALGATPAQAEQGAVAPPGTAVVNGNTYTGAMALSEAVNAASPGDTVLLGSGTFYGPVVLDDVSIEGSGPSTVITNVNALPNRVLIRAYGASLKPLDIENVVFAPNFSEGGMVIRYQDLHDGQTVMIRNDWFAPIPGAQSTAGGILMAAGSSATLDVENDTFDNLSTGMLLMVDGSSGNFIGPDAVIDANKFTGVATGVQVLYAGDVQPGGYGTISNNAFDLATGDTAVSISASPTGCNDSFGITGNNFDFDGYGIFDSEATNVTVHGNWWASHNGPNTGGASLVGVSTTGFAPTPNKLQGVGASPIR